MQPMRHLASHKSAYAAVKGNIYMQWKFSGMLFAPGLSRVYVSFYEGLWECCLVYILNGKVRGREAGGYARWRI